MQFILLKGEDMKHAVAFDEGYSPTKLGPIDEDPVLARCQMGLAQLGSQCLATSGAAIGAPTGGNMMGFLAGMMAHGSSGGGTTTTTSGGSSAGPAIAAGAGGLAAGLGVGALAFSGSGKKDEKPAEKKEEKPKTDTGKTAAPDAKTTPATTGTTTSSATTTPTDTKKEPTPPPGGGTVPEPPTAAPTTKVEDTSSMGFSPNGLTLTPLSTPTELSVPTSK